MMTEKQARAAFPAAYKRMQGDLHPRLFGGSYHVCMAHVMRALVDEPSIAPEIKAVAWISIRAHVETETVPAVRERGRPFTNLFPEVSV